MVQYFNYNLLPLQNQGDDSKYLLLMFKIKKDVHLSGAKKGMPVKGGRLFGSHKQEASLSSIPEAKTEEDAVVGKNQIDCNRIAKREPEDNFTFFKPK